MPSNFPTSLDSLTNPIGGDQTTSVTVPHASQHTNINDIMEAMESKVGIGSSTPTARKLLVGSGTGSSGWVDNAGPTLIVAANDSHSFNKALANYVCDNSADDVEINAALAALPSGGGQVLLCEGTYTLANQISMPKANCILQGMGMGSTTLFLGSGAAGANGAIVLLGQSLSILRDVTINGNKAGNGSANSMLTVSITAATCKVQNVRVQNSKGAGISFSSASSMGLVEDSIVTSCDTTGIVMDSNSTYPHRVQGCVVYSNTLDGIGVNGGARHQVMNCVAEANGEYGIITGAANAQLVGNLVRSNSSHGLYISGARNLISGNTVLYNGGYGIAIPGGTAAQVVGNFVEGNSTNADMGGSGILCTSVNDVFIQGNMVRRGTGSNQQKYGIDIQSGSSNNFIGVNDLHDSGRTAQVSDSGTNTRRAARFQYDWTSSADLISGASWTANSWNSVIQPTISGLLQFRVNSPQSLIVVITQGHAVLVTSTTNVQSGARVVVDSSSTVFKRISGGAQNTSGQYIGQSLSGVAVFENLSTGTHTLDIQIQANNAVTAYLQAGSAAQVQHLGVQIVEIER